MSGTGDRRAAPPVDLNVINYQVGALQTSLDRGLAALERAMEKGFDGVSIRLDRIEERQGAMEKREERQLARIEALEEFRRDQEIKEDEFTRLQRAELKAAVDGSSEAKLFRILTGIAVALLGVAGTIIAIIAALGGFS